MKLFILINIVLCLVNIYLHITKERWLIAFLDFKRIMHFYNDLYDTANDFYNNICVTNNNAPLNMKLDIKEWSNTAVTCLEDVLRSLKTIGDKDTVYHQLMALCPPKSVIWYHKVCIINIMHIIFGIILLCMLPIKYLIPYGCISLFLLASTKASDICTTQVKSPVPHIYPNTWVHIISNIAYISIYISLIIGGI